MDNDQETSIAVTSGSQDKEWVVCWKTGQTDAYRLVHFGAPSDTFDLPGRSVLLTVERLKQSRNTLVYSERSGGTRGFLNWLSNQLDPPDQHSITPYSNETGEDKRKTGDDKRPPWIAIRGDGWNKSFFKMSCRARKLFENKKGQEYLKAIEKFGITGPPTEGANALAYWAENLGEPFFLIIRDLESLDSQARDAATALGLFAEHHRNCEHLRIVVASTSQHLYTDTFEGSGFLAQCNQFRLPYLTVDEVSLLAKHDTGRGLSLVIIRDLVDDIIDVTGGQPLLVKNLLSRVQRTFSENSYPDVRKEHIRQVYAELRRSPPPIVWRWREELQHLLLQRPELIHPLREYVAGKSQSLGPGSYPPPAAERPLMIAGWLGVNRLGRWGISSKLHAHYASQVLDTVGEGK